MTSKPYVDKSLRAPEISGSFGSITAREAVTLTRDARVEVDALDRRFAAQRKAAGRIAGEVVRAQERVRRPVR